MEKVVPYFCNRMLKRILFVTTSLLLCASLSAQVNVDSLNQDTSRRPTPDTLEPQKIKVVAVQPGQGDTDSASLAMPDTTTIDTSFFQAESIPPPPVQERKDAPRRVVQGKEVFFYVLIALVLIFGLLRQAFPKYFNDLFRLFFRRTLKQRQLYEQMVQTPLPSFFLNIYFLVTGGLYISVLLEYYQLSKVDNYWIQSLYCAIGLGAIYLVKFASLKFTGWLFNLRGPADEYAFIIFLINKIIGMLLLPCLIFIFLSKPGLAYFIVVLSWVGIGLLFCYRLILTFQLAHNRVKVNLFHFVLYILTFEIIPLLLIYRLLLMVF